MPLRMDMPVIVIMSAITMDVRMCICMTILVRVHMLVYMFVIVSVSVQSIMLVIVCVFVDISHNKIPLTVHLIVNVCLIKHALILSESGILWNPGRGIVISILQSITGWRAVHLSDIIPVYAAILTLYMCGADSAWHNYSMTIFL